VSYETLSFFAVITTPRCWNLSWVGWIQSTTSQFFLKAYTNTGPPSHKHLALSRALFSTFSYHQEWFSSIQFNPINFLFIYMLTQEPSFLEWGETESTWYVAH
jgi:hypothetical protein